MKSTSSPQPLDIAAAAENLNSNPADPVAAKFAELLAAYASHDQARVDLVLAEISGLAAREERAEQVRPAGYPPAESAGLRIHQPSLLETLPS